MPELEFDVVWLGSGQRPLPEPLKLEFTWRKSHLYQEKLALLLQKELCAKVPGFAKPHFVKATLGSGGPELTPHPRLLMHLRDDASLSTSGKGTWSHLYDNYALKNKRRKLKSCGAASTPTLTLSQYSQRDVDIAYITFRGGKASYDRGSQSDLAPLQKRHLTDGKTFLAVAEHLGVDCFNQASLEIQRDKNIALALLGIVYDRGLHAGAATVIDIFRCNPALRCDRNFVWTVFNYDVENLLYMSDELKCDCDFAKLVVHKTKALCYFSDAVRSNIDVVLTALHADPLALQYATKTICSNIEIVKLALTTNAKALAYASEALRSNKDLVLEAVGRDGLALRYASEVFQADFDVVLCAVKNCGAMLGVASDALRANKELVLEAVRNDGGALQYAAFELRDDVDVVTAALRNSQQRRYCDANKFVSDRLRADRNIALLIVAQGYEGIRYVLGDLHCDEEVARASMSRHANQTHKYISDSLYAKLKPP